MSIETYTQTMNMESGIVIRNIIQKTNCQDACIDSITKISQGKFVCTLVHTTDVIRSPSNKIKYCHLTIELTGKMMKKVAKIDVMSLDCTPMGEMYIEENDWIYTFTGTVKSCLACPKHRACGASFSDYPSYVLFIHLKEPESYDYPIFQNIASLLKNGTGADMTFEIGGNNLPAHTLIVGASSPVLAAMFRSDFKEGRTQIVKIEDTTTEVFQQFLNYLYTNDVPDMGKKGIAAGLFELADKYAVDSLKEESAIFLAEQLNVENAVETLIAAHLHSSESLLQETLLFMSTNGVDYLSRPDWLPLMENYPKLCFRAIRFIVTTLTK